MKFSDVTLLITHYNRSQSLERLLTAFKNQKVEFGGIVVSDDCSKAEHLERLRQLQDVFGYNLVTTPKNGGLGNNINKGQDAVTTPYTLYVQEDFDPFAGFGVHLKNALELMTDRPDLDMARFYAYFKYPYLRPLKYGFSEMIFKIWYPGYRKFHCYSDHPHLRRNTFFQKFGRYPEGIVGDKTEFTMALSFLKNKGKGIFFDDFKGVFDQLNSNDEPSTMRRAGIKYSNSAFITFARAIYRNVVHTFKYFSQARIRP